MEPSIAAPEGAQQMFNEATLREVRKAKERAQRARAKEEGTDHRLPPGVFPLEAGTAAYALGSLHRRAREGSDGGLVLGAALQTFAMLAHGSPLAPHAEAIATGLLAACAYRAGLATGRPLPGAALTCPASQPKRRLEITVGRVVATEWP
jgi:hypothetical protein